MSKKNIFVSYRREDSTGETFQLVKSLKQFINGQKIFLDNEKLEPGQDFPKVLKQHLKDCDIILVVIGKKWLEYNGDNSLPLSDEGNWVRIEIATAIRQGNELSLLYSSHFFPITTNIISQSFRCCFNTFGKSCPGSNFSLSKKIFCSLMNCFSDFTN